ncbi:hypothetical protein Y032_0498g2534 [Ancylostoma ceylanicum]|uniref:Uncharacterized protein n=1 Tax=Ancylostoma ceylanicum TaxID=53326 RepID=A0A016WUK6_9BILA|nr:hypothetical protein Y032_0498g2534 [Ancylostoma ceylanicum]
MVLQHGYNMSNATGTMTTMRVRKQKSNRKCHFSSCFPLYNYHNYDLQIPLNLLFYCLEVDPPIREEWTTLPPTTVRLQSWVKCG